MVSMLDRLTPQLEQSSDFSVLFLGDYVDRGIHGIEVLIFLMALNGVFERRGHYEMVEKTGLYWHFVDLVWVFVFTFFYLI